MLQQTTTLSPNDHRLIEEAVHRIERSEADAVAKRALVHEAMVDQLRRGRRDMFTLVRTGRRVVQAG